MTDDSLLPIVAQQGARSLGLSTFVAGFSDDDGRFHSVVAEGFTPEAAAAYNQMSHLDPWARELSARPRGRCYAAGELVPRDTLMGSAFYNEFLRPHLGRDMVHGVMAAVGSEKSPGNVGGVRARSCGELAAPEKAIAQRMLPHLQRLITVRRHIRDGEHKPRSTEMLDMLAAPVIATDPAGRILYMNARGEAMLQRQICLTYARDGGLGAVQAADNERLRAAIAAAGRDKASTVVLHRAAGGRPVSAVVAPSRAVSSVRHALIVINDPDVQTTPERLKELFGLSTAEAEVSVGLAAGRSLEEIAEQRKVAVSTLRVQLKSIYAKTATSRQAELVSLIAGLHRFDVG